MFDRSKYPLSHSRIDDWNTSFSSISTFVQPPALNNQPTITRQYLSMSESIEEDVQILNHCLDDIEYFVAHLLKHNKIKSDLIEQTKKRSKKVDKKKQEDADLSIVTTNNLVEDKHYIDILQKFKLSFNLLAKLKQHIHDPNSPELLHFIFTPLQLIYRSMLATKNGAVLVKTIWSPLLTRETKELLINCLTSKEYELWQSLGDSWTICEDEISTNTHNYETYNPVFYNGWAPILQLNNIKTTKYLSKQLSNKDIDINKWASNLNQHGIKIFEVITDRNGNNDKELSVKSGELLEILDDTKNWWRVRNAYGQIGHVPHTILHLYEQQKHQEFENIYM